MEDFADRVAIVAGGAGGVGEAVCRRLADRGGKVAVLDLRREAAEETAKQLGGRDAMGLAVDMTDYAQVKEAVQRVIGEWGRVDVLVNVIGWNVHTFFRDEGPEYWRKIVDINLMSQVYACHAVLDNMVERRNGAIVTVSSDAGRVGTNGETMYAAAKGGVIAFTKSLAREVTRFGIRVNCIAPGPTDTPFLRRVMGEQPEIVQKMTSLIPMKRIAQPDEQAAAIVFLASDDASYITGQVLSVNGGLNMVG